MYSMILLQAGDNAGLMNILMIVVESSLMKTNSNLNILRQRLRVHIVRRNRIIIS